MKIHTGFLWFGLLFTLSGSAQAHFTLVTPASAISIETGGKGAPPCGDGPLSGKVTEAIGGHPLPIQFQEFVFHPGHYRVALSVLSRSELPPDPSVADSDGISISASIQNPPKIPLLADGLFAHTDPPSADWRGQITLPNLDCDKCTLQVLEFMAEHGAPYFYHHCADLRIKSDPALPPADAAWPRATVPSGRSTSAALAHVANGGGWQTSITLVNLDTVPASFALKFHGDNGALAEVGVTGQGRLSTVSGTLRPGGAQTIQTDGSPPEMTGWVELASPQFIDGTAIFRFSSGQEASVPLQATGNRRLVFPLEAAAGTALGIALANASADDTTVQITVRNEQGDVIATPPTLALGRGQHASFVPAGLPLSTAPLRGTVELNSTNADILALGIRANGGTFTSIRPMNK